MNSLDVNIVLLEGGKMPERMSKGAAAYDVYAAKDTIIKTGRNLIPLGFCMEFSPDWEVLIDARSGFSTKGFEGYRMPDIEMQEPLRFDADILQGKGDSDYRGEYHAIVKSFEGSPFRVKAGTRIAQITFVPVGTAKFHKCESLNETERGGNGFNSTGTK